MTDQETQVLENEEEKKPSKVGLFLNKFFHFYDRGTTMKSEIGAGIGAFFIAVCALLMNTQIIGAAYGNYAGSYLAVTLITFIGSLVFGIVCNLPLLQTANMATSSVLISMLGANTGLTYANLMFITFIAAVIYLVITVSPLRNYVVDVLPEGVRKALPVAVGLFVMMTALKNTGLVTDGGLLSGSSAQEGDLNKYYFWLLIAATVLFVVLKGFKRKKPMFATFGILIGCMWVGGILFFMDWFIGGTTATTVIYERLNLFFATDGASPYNIGFAIGQLKIGQLFTEGLNFTAFTEAGGNVVLVVVQGVLTYLFMGMYGNVGNLHAIAYTSDAFIGEDGTIVNENKAYVIGAALNVLAPVLGASPTSIGTQSAVATNDGAKTGLSSIVASVGFLIAMFTWLFFAFFATGTNGVGMWINETEVKLAAYVQDTFIFADLIMVFVGASMLKAVKDCNFTDVQEVIPFAAVVAGAVFAGNIAFGVALGVVLSAVTKLVARKFNEFTVPTIVADAIMLLYVVIALI